MANDFDLIVIGAGSAGFSASITAAELGARVALVGHGTIGGTCVNVGCVPSKALIRAMEAVHHANTAARFGGIAGQARVTDWRATVANKDALVAELRQAKYIDLLPSYDNITYLESRAQLMPEGVAVKDGLLRVPKMIVATGSEQTVPPIPGMKDVPYLTSTTALEMETLPDSMIVMGAGYIGCELAQMFARAGVEVTLVCRSRLLPESEPEISEALTEVFRNEGITVLDGISYTSIEHTQAGITLDITRESAPETLNAEHILISTGRQANTEGLNLSALGVEMNANGGIQINDYLQTTNPNIYAAGDVTGRDQFVYMAAYGAKLAAEHAITGRARAYDATAMPAVTFTDPQVSGVGLTENAAKARGNEIKTAILPLDYLPRALAARDTRGLIKLVADKETDKLLGAHIMAPEGADSIQTAALAIKHGLTAQDLAETIFPYLTTVEGLKLAAQTFDKDVTKLSCCAG